MYVLGAAAKCKSLKWDFGAVRLVSGLHFLDLGHVRSSLMFLPSLRPFEFVIQSREEAEIRSNSFLQILCHGSMQT